MATVSEPRTYANFALKVSTVMFISERERARIKSTQQRRLTGLFKHAVGGVTSTTKFALIARAHAELKTHWLNFAVAQLNDTHAHHQGVP